MVRRIKIMLYESFHSFVGFYSYPFARDVAVDSSNFRPSTQPEGSAEIDQ